MNNISNEESVLSFEEIQRNLANTKPMLRLTVKYYFWRVQYMIIRI